MASADDLLIRHVSPNRSPRWFLPALVVAPATILLAFFALPVVHLVLRVARWSAISHTLSAPSLWRVAWFTLWQALVSAVATLLVGLIPTWALARTRFPGRRLVLTVVTVPFMLPTVVVGAAFLALLPQRLHGTALAVIVAHVYFNIAVVVRVVGALWATIPADLESAARTLGASPWQVHRHVVLPLLRPALLAASSITFLFSFTSYGVVRLLGGPSHASIETEVVRHALGLGDVAGAAVLAVLQLIALGGVVWWSSRLQRRASRTWRAGRTPAVMMASTWRVVTAVGAAGAMAVPLAVLVVQSLRNDGGWSLAAWRGLQRTEIRPGISLGVDPLDAIATSVRYAVVATAIATAAGTLAALVINEGRQISRLLDVGVMLPLGTSAVTVALGILITFDTAPFDWRGEWWLVPLGHSMIALPFVVRTVLPVVRAIPTAQREAAATLGASPVRGWWQIVVRRLARPVATGAGFAAAISLGEFGASTLLSRAGHDTLPVAIGTLLARTGAIPRAQAYALSTILLVVCGVLVVFLEPASPYDTPRGGR